MGAWKDWQQGMQEDGFTAAEIRAAEARIKGTPADPAIAATRRCRLHPDGSCIADAIADLKAAFPGAQLVE